jgi:hypothetical protein
MAELFYRDDWAGVTHTIDRIDDNTVVVHTSGDVQPILDANKHDANHGNPWSPSRDLKHVARIPTEIYMIWLHRFGIDALNHEHAAAVRKLLNDPEWMYLRTGGGRL